MIKEILLPDLGEGIDGAEVSEISVSVGDTVSVNDTLLVLESDKASMEIPSDVAGVVKEIITKEGDEVKTGHVLIKIELSNDQKEEVKIEKEKQSDIIDNVPKIDIAIENNQQPIKDDGISRSVFASPGVRRLARELNINLEIIKGSGLKGRITKDDLNSYIKLQMAISSGSIPQPEPVIDFSQWGNIETQKLTRIKKTTGVRLQSAWNTIPHVTQYNEADITQLDKIRKTMKKDGEVDGIKITFLPFLIKAATSVLQEMPIFNSSLDHTKENLILKKYYHIGIAVNTDGGLVVPVVRDVEKKSIFDLSQELMDISNRARNKKLKPNEMKGGTFTISSLGGIGGTAFSPIVNPPEVAILGISRSALRPVYNPESSNFAPRLIMPFSLSYDHRVIDGAAAAMFTQKFSEALNGIQE